MTAQLPKTYDPTTVETDAHRAWTQARAFHADPATGGDPFSIVIPPPNVTAALHLGHALNNALQDILIRWRRMAGDNAVWIPGTDHAGIATQTVVEKRVLAEEGKKRTDFARDEFVARIQAWKDEYEARIIEQLKRMGCSCDWDRQSFTMDEPRAKAVREAFFRLFRDGLIYRGKRLVNWDPVTQTALADDEVEMEEVEGKFYYLRYPLMEGSGIRVQGSDEAEYITVATTRPETMLGDTAVAINPKDPRAAALRGRKIRLPIVNRVIPIIEDDYVVMPDPKSEDAKARYATGFLKVTPAHDPNDYEIGRRHNLPTVNVFAPDASISNAHGWSDIGDAGFLIGQSREIARESVVKWFREHGLLEEIKPYRHSIGYSYRSHVPIEPYLSDQWYCRVTDDRLAGAALRSMAEDQRGTGDPPVAAPGSTGFQPVAENSHGQVARATELRFHPARYAKTFQAWHENIRDWCISRQLWWGHRIPVWRHDAAPADSIEWLKKQTAPSSFHLMQAGAAAFVCLKQSPEQDTEAGMLRDRLENWGFAQDPDVLDTWFSSALWPMSTLGWPLESEISDLKSALNVWNPTSVICTAREIITLWVSRMVMFNLYFLDRLPFRDVFIHAMIQDGHGQKMSKSLGNGVDPLDIIHSHGADAMRFTLASMATNTQDVRMPVDMIDPHTGETFTPRYITESTGYQVAAPIQESPKDPKKKMVSSYGVASGKGQPTAEMPVARNTSGKFDLGRNFCNKLWNAARFVMMSLEGSDEATRRRSHEGAQKPRSLADRWIVSRFNRTIADAEEGLRTYRFDQYAKACYDFFWRDFCDWYLEAIKPAMKDPERVGRTAAVLQGILDGTLRLMHPVIPFITEAIWARLKSTSTGGPASSTGDLLIRSAWPQAGPVNDEDESAFTTLQEIITAVRNLRNEHKVDPRRMVTICIGGPAEMCHLVAAGQEMIELLAVAKLREIGPRISPAPGAAKAVAAGCEIHVEDLANPAADQGRIIKRREELAKQITALEGRLANPSYAAKAPPRLVQQTKDQLAAAREELAKLG